MASISFEHVPKRYPDGFEAVNTSQLQLFDHETGEILLSSDSSPLEAREPTTTSGRRLIA